MALVLAVTGEGWRRAPLTNGERDDCVAHAWSVLTDAATITSYHDAFKNKGLPLVIGEFGWHFAASEVDDQTVVAQAVARGIGYLGWSWAGNNDSRLDMTNNFDPNQLTTWGQRIINGPNGIKATAQEATIYRQR